MMAREFPEVAHTRTDLKKFGEGYDRVFGKKLLEIPREEEEIITSLENLDAFFLVCEEQETFVDKFYDGIHTTTSPRSLGDAKKKQEVYREEGVKTEIYFITVKKVVETVVN